MPKLIAPCPRQHVTGAQGRNQSPRKGDEQFVAGKLPIDSLIRLNRRMSTTSTAYHWPRSPATIPAARTAR